MKLRDKTEHIKKIESHLFPSPLKGKKVVFRKVNPELRIRNFQWPFEVRRSLSFFPSLGVYPASPGLWLKKLRNKHEGKGGRNLIGYLILWVLAPKEKYHIQADAFLIKKERSLVLYYFSNDVPCVVKANVGIKNNPRFRRLFQRELESVEIAKTIQHRVVGIPLIMAHNLEGDFLYISQEYILDGKALFHLPESKRKETMVQVMDFMFEFYKKNAISLISLSDKKFLVDQDLIHRIKELPDGEKKFLKYKSLAEQNKNLLWGRIHDDLNPANILVRTDGKIVIIDWASSKEQFVVEEFKNFKFIDRELAEGLFNKLMAYLEITDEKVYNIEEHLFLLRIRRKILGYKTFQRRNEY